MFDNLRAKRYRCLGCKTEKHMTTVSYKTLEFYCSKCRMVRDHQCLDRPPAAELYEVDEHNDNVLRLKRNED